MELINKVFDVLGMPGVIGACAFALEIALRLIKSEKPRSLIYAASGGVRRFCQVLVKAAEYGEKLAQFLDKVIPQRLKGE